VWFVVEYGLGVRLGFAPILVGPLAAAGAVAIGRRRGRRVGWIAAAVTALGVLCGTYGSYLATRRHTERKLAEVRSRGEHVAPEEAPALRALETRLVELGYVDSLTEKRSTLVFVLVFSVLGMSFGFGLSRERPRPGQILA
jgi:hypothetical protein